MCFLFSSFFLFETPFTNVLIYVSFFIKCDSERFGDGCLRLFPSLAYFAATSGRDSGSPEAPRGHVREIEGQARQNLRELLFQPSNASFLCYIEPFLIPGLLQPLISLPLILSLLFISRTNMPCFTRASLWNHLVGTTLTALQPWSHSLCRT